MLSPMTPLQPTLKHPPQEWNPTDLRLDRGEIKDVRLLGTSKVGTTSWSGRLGSQPVKIFRCASNSQAELLEWLADHPTLGAHFPACFERQEDLVVVEWVEGEVLEKREYRKQGRVIEATAELLARLHTTSLPPGLVVGDLYGSYLIRRGREQANKLSSPEILYGLTESLEAELLETGSGRRPVLTHPDLAPQNLVLKPEGALCAIDNELAGESRSPGIDLLNPWRYFGRGLRARRNLTRYLRAYDDAGGRLDSLVDDSTATQALWTLRRIGSLLEAGRTVEADAVARRARDLGGGTHPILKAARRLIG